MDICYRIRIDMSMCMHYKDIYKDRIFDSIKHEQKRHPHARVSFFVQKSR